MCCSGKNGDNLVHIVAIEVHLLSLKLPSSPNLELLETSFPLPALVPTGPISCRQTAIVCLHQQLQHAFQWQTSCSLYNDRLQDLLL